MTPSHQPDPRVALDRLHTRLVTVADVLGVDNPPDTSTSGILQQLLTSVRRDADSSRAWLLYIAISGSMPSARSLATFMRELASGPISTLLLRALEACIDDAVASRDNLLRTLRIVDRGLVVDVNFCASHEHNTGIQRVVRETVPRWRGSAEHVLVVWSDEMTAYRGLTLEENDRVVNWNHRQFPPARSGTRPPQNSLEIVVPWRSIVLLTEVPQSFYLERLQALAESSGNELKAIVYDAIPVVSGFAVTQQEAEQFSRYLSVVKHAVAIAAISESAADEFRGFTSALPSQGLVGPTVSSVILPVDVPERARVLAALAPGDSGRLPVVVCVGSHEPRKNQEAVLFAVQRLYAEGHKFEMIFVGRGMRRNTADFDRRVRALARGGHAVHAIRDVSDKQLWSLYGRARFSVFVSLHEGYGLPVAESLALGTPVLTSNYGSLAEIAVTGGCLMVDPRNDEEIVSAMRRMIVEDELIDHLIGEIHLSPRTWDDYAEEVFSTLGLGTVR